MGSGQFWLVWYGISREDCSCSHQVRRGGVKFRTYRDHMGEGLGLLGVLKTVNTLQLQLRLTFGVVLISLDWSWFVWFRSGLLCSVLVSGLLFLRSQSQHGNHQILTKKDGSSNLYKLASLSRPSSFTTKSVYHFKNFGRN